MGRPRRDPAGAAAAQSGRPGEGGGVAEVRTGWKRGSDLREEVGDPKGRSQAPAGPRGKDELPQLGARGGVTAFSKTVENTVNFICKSNAFAFPFTSVVSNLEP